jgi:phosphomevalonate kinase
VEGIDPRVGALAIRSERLKSSYCCMLDLKKGSNTRKMVSGFITALNLQPAEVVGEFYTGSKGFVQSVYEVITGEEDFAVIKARLREINKAYRVFLQKYSTLTGIPVEPAEFRSFLDQICSIDAVLYAICPGSGGYDAIFVLSAAQN